MSASELSRMIKPRALPAGELAIEASEAERAALAARFGITALPAVSATVAFVPKGEAVLARGSLAATVEQPCAISREDFTYDVAEDFELRFVPAGERAEHEPDEEFELAADDLDEIEYEGDAFDIGEAIAQELGLAIDPYREGPDADRIRAEKGIESDEDRAPSGPLAEALAALKGREG